MTEPAQNLAVIGLPGSGKTTYLAALYHALADSSVPPKLQQLPKQRAYLEQIRESWLAGEAVDRTAVGTGEVIELDADFGPHRLAVRIPDISGESFTEGLVTRMVDNALADVFRRCSGLLLFAHPHDLRPRVLIPNAEALGLCSTPLDDQAESVNEVFDPGKIPNEVQLVDLLQWVSGLAGSISNRRVALVISAWDELVNIATPEQWFHQMPMLRQFFQTSDKYTLRVFGVSAQGGTYAGDNPAKIAPSVRPFVVTEEGARSNDISLPLRWISE